MAKLQDGGKCSNRFWAPYDFTDERRLTQSFNKNIASPNLVCFTRFILISQGMSISLTTLSSRILFLSYIALFILELSSGDCVYVSVYLSVYVSVYVFM
jgi:hypothetical protein